MSEGDDGTAAVFPGHGEINDCIGCYCCAVTMLPVLFPHALERRNSPRWRHDLGAKRRRPRP